MRMPLVLVIAMLALSSSCISIPHDGPVQAVEANEDLAQSSTRFAPAGPRAGANKTEIVHGFLESMLAYPESLVTANQFLSPDAIQTWDPQSSSLIYTKVRVVSPANGDTLSLDLDVTSQLDSRGRLTQRDEKRSIDVSLVKHEGEWRIDQPPPGVLLSEDFVNSNMRPFELFFFDESGSRLISEPVHAVVGEKLATTLMHRLALGPRKDSAIWQRTFVPTTQQMQASVPLIEGRAEVEIGAAVRDRPVGDADRMAAQIISTLSQVPGVSDVRVSASDGVVVETSDQREGIQAWTAFQTDDLRRHAHGVANNRVWRIDSPQPRPAPGYLAKDAQGARGVALSRERIAAVWANRAESATLQGDDPVRVTGQSFLEPAVDVADTAWFVDQPAGTSRIRVVDAKGSRTIGLPKELNVASFAISPDGARIALSTEAGEIYVGRVIRQASGVRHITRMERIEVEEQGVRDVQWLTATSLLFIAKDTPRQLREVRIDGSRTVTSWSALGRWLPDVTVNRLVVAPGIEPLVMISDSERRVWVWESSKWELANINKVRGLS